MRKKAKGKVSKKTARKKTGKKKQTRIKNAPPEKCFWVHNGPIIKNLKELRDAIKTMNDGQFYHHTKERGNDFAEWVDQVIGNATCAKALRRTKTRSGAEKVIARYLK